jgi:hypothetical protein
MMATGRLLRFPIGQKSFAQMGNNQVTVKGNTVNLKNQTKLFLVIETDATRALCKPLTPKKAIAKWYPLDELEIAKRAPIRVWM